MAKKPAAKAAPKPRATRADQTAEARPTLLAKKAAAQDQFDAADDVAMTTLRQAVNPF